MATYPDIDTLHAALRDCRLCIEAGHPIEGLPVFSGSQSARLMLVGQAPGAAEEGTRHMPFGGGAGARLFQWLARAGWDEQSFRASCYMTSVTKCFPGKSMSGNGDRVPSVAEQKLCRPWLEAELALVQPAVIVPVGSLAIRLFWPQQAGGKLKLNDVVGEAVVDDAGRHIVPLPHPSGASRWHNDPRNVGRLERALFRLRALRLELGL